MQSDSRKSEAQTQAAQAAVYLAVFGSVNRYHIIADILNHFCRFRVMSRDKHMVIDPDTVGRIGLVFRNDIFVVFCEVRFVNEFPLL